LIAFTDQAGLLLALGIPEQKGGRADQFLTLHPGQLSFRGFGDVELDAQAGCQQGLRLRQNQHFALHFHAADTPVSEDIDNHRALFASGLSDGGIDGGRITEFGEAGCYSQRVRAQ